MSTSRRAVLGMIATAAVAGPLVTLPATPAFAADLYGSNTDLYADPNLTEGVDYARRLRRHAPVSYTHLTLPTNREV